MWHTVLTTLQAEFSDIPDLQQFTRIVLRLLLAAALGAALGYERERHGKSAGVRTHMLVALGAALFVLVPELAGVPEGDLTRVIQGVITGIGFLGAGSIIKSENEERVQGLTTAAGIWLTAAIGICCGLGRDGTAVLTALLAVAILALVPHLSSVKDK
jgi:putative Mg2+ transporter-C (MgtC) family protein